MSTLRPSRRTLLINPAPTEAEENGLYIPEAARIEPNFGRVVKSGRGCRCYENDTVFFLHGAIERINEDFALIPERYCYFMYDGKNPGVENMLLHNGWVLIKVHYFISKETNSGLFTGDQNASEGQVAMTVRYGTIVQASRTAYDDEDPIISSYVDKSTSVRVQKGDTVFFSHYIMNAIQQNHYLYQSAFVAPNGDQYIIIPYKELICKKAKDGLVALNEYCVAERPEEKSGLLLPDDYVKYIDIDTYVCSTDTEFTTKGEKLIVNPAMKGIPLEPAGLETLDKKYVYFKKDYILLGVQDEKVSFKKEKSLN